MATFTGADKAIKYLFDVVANIADDYDSSATYAVGDFVLYAGTLYKCATAISQPEDFTPAHWSAVLVMDEITAGGGGGTTVVANPAGAATDTLNKLQVGATIYDVPSGGGGSLSTYHAAWTATSSNTTGAVLTGPMLVSAGKYLVIAHTPTSDTQSMSEPFLFAIKNGNTIIDSTYTLCNKQYGSFSVIVELSQAANLYLCTGWSASGGWNASYLTRGGIDAIKIA